ncbi:UNVERIFIED_CONTAM: hypothetical protein FKN15_044476 [Acipenser sinensis]
MAAVIPPVTGQSITKKLLAISVRKEYQTVKDWISSIINHLYWCATTSDGNSDLVIEMTSISMRMTGFPSVQLNDRN